MSEMNVIDLLLRLLTAESITPDDAGLMEFVESYLPDYEAIYYNQEDVKNLFLTKKFGKGDHFCFAGHIDVVPAGKGWESNPFVPKISDGTIYARGAQDMKSGVAAAMAVLREVEDFEGRLSLLLTSDEEGDAIHGTKIMLEHLKSIDLLPEYCVVAEPTCEVEFGDAIKIGRRGSINGYLTIKGKQGHAAYPEKSTNPVHLFAPRMVQMAGVDLDNGDDDFASSKLVITDIRGGMEVTNVTPDELKIMFNVRNNTLTTTEDIREFVDGVCEGLEYALELTQSSSPFVTKRESPLITNISRTVEKVTSHTPMLSTAGGTSDARFMGEYGVDVVEFGVRNDTIHAANERVHISEVEGLKRVFSDLIKGWR
jgi:succinyl-diaminopimelate desuccinylase